MEGHGGERWTQVKRLREKEGKGVGEIMDCKKGECEARFEKKEAARREGRRQTGEVERG